MKKNKRVRPPRARNGIAIKSWMLIKGITQADIVRATGLNKGLVCRTVNGDRNCQKVLDYLKTREIPPGLLWQEQQARKRK